MNHEWDKKEELATWERGCKRGKERMSKTWKIGHEGELIQNPKRKGQKIN